MPFKKHAEFQPPSNPDTPIWRYMDVTKFLSLIDKAALYFVRLDQLAGQDQFEGYYTNANLKIDGSRYEDFSDEWKEENGIKDKASFDFVSHGMDMIRDKVKIDRECAGVSSWHAQEHESAAMWSLYHRSQDGIAIQTTYNELISALSGFDDFDIRIGMIKYIDYETEEIPLKNLFAPYLYKRKSFEHERELRALIWQLPYRREDTANPIKNYCINNDGIYVPVNLDSLIEKIYISPTSPAWVVELVKSIIKKWDLDKEVIHSSLADSPIY